MAWASPLAASIHVTRSGATWSDCALKRSPVASVSVAVERSARSLTTARTCSAEGSRARVCVQLARKTAPGIRRYMRRIAVGSL